MNITYSTIYPELNQLEMFCHPKTGLRYHFLNNLQLIELAERALTDLLAMGIEKVIVAESGAVPFAKICAWITWKKNLPLKWYALKIPRNISDNSAITLQTYCSLSLDDLSLSPTVNTESRGFSYSKNTHATLLPIEYFAVNGRNLGEILAAIQEPSSIPNNVLDLTKTSALAKLLQQPFIFFDEYIDSGTTLFQTFRFFHLFAKSLQFKLFSYLIKLPESALDKNRVTSLYYQDDEFQAYAWGVYPFENRIDWLGYYYFVTPKKFSKIGVSEFHAPKVRDVDFHCLIDLLLMHEQYLAELRTYCSVPQVAQFISQAHFLQFSLYLLEEIHYGKSKYSEFLYQLFDLYGPIWSPLPDEYHLSYLQAFARIKDKMTQFLIEKTITEHYQRSRKEIFHHLAELMTTRRMHQQQTLLNILENKYAA